MPPVPFRRPDPLHVSATPRPPPDRARCCFARVATRLDSPAMTHAPAGRPWPTTAQLGAHRSTRHRACPSCTGAQALPALLDTRSHQTSATTPSLRPRCAANLRHTATRTPAYTAPPHRQPPRPLSAHHPLSPRRAATKAANPTTTSPSPMSADAYSRTGLPAK